MKPIQVFTVFRRGEVWIAQLQEAGINGAAPRVAQCRVLVPVEPDGKDFGKIIDPVASDKIASMLAAALELTPQQLDDANRIVAEQTPSQVLQ